LATFTATTGGNLMEILCPNCQRKLTILEQYAGQMMKCPLCAGTFTAPALPPAPAEPTAAAYAVQAPPAAPLPETSATPPAVPGSAPPGLAPSAPSAPGSPEPAPTEPTRRFSLWISPLVGQYLPVALLFLVFVLTFFPWVGIRSGGVWLDSQSAWQAMWGSTSTPDKDAEPLSWFNGKKDRQKVALPQPLAGAAEKPGFGVIALFYLLLLLFNLLVAAVAATAEYSRGFLPPAVHQYLSWRWAAAALVTLVAFAMLLLQDSVGFNLERSAHDAVNKVTKKYEDDWTEQQKLGAFPGMEAKEVPTDVLIFRGTYEQAIVQTFSYRCAFWFHFWALVFVVGTMLTELRWQRPCPRVDVLW